MDKCLMWTNRTRNYLTTFGFDWKQMGSWNIACFGANKWLSKDTNKPPMPLSDLFTEYEINQAPNNPSSMIPKILP